MKKETRNIIIGIIMMAGGLYGMTLKIDNTGHYFGTGAFFGIGICLAGSALFKMIRK